MIIKDRIELEIKKTDEFQFKIDKNQLVIEGNNIIIRLNFFTEEYFKGLLPDDYIK